MAGYDLPTVSRMTPEDLTAIGIQHPGHRKKLKAAISCLNVPDGLPSFLPVISVLPCMVYNYLVQGSIAEWLRMIRLEEYGPGLRQQGYTTIQDICTVSIEDLEDIGFYRLGHQKRLLLAIKKIKEIIQGGGEQVSDCVYQTQEISVTSLQPAPIPSVPPSS